ncbi:MAG: lipopolysaccharide transport periplasmic protein LptA [Candidatus Adiutrix sp.]|nr:lipopolysaccharide transport periplasmic protein LptA [Candidatus Adiutrix sp.]
MKIDIFKQLTLLALLLGLTQASLAEAQLRPGGGGRNRGPIAISSDRVETDDRSGVVTFIGAVVARQAEMTITCDLMKVYYSPGEAAGREGGASPFEGGQGRQIQRVEGEGSVKVVDGDRLAVADRAVYLAQNVPRRIVLTGQARVWQGGNSVAGHEVVYDLDNGRSLVTSRQRERVRAVYQQAEESQAGPQASGENGAE